jgi:membrane protein YqaA with SNARE-associated domain
MNIDHLLLIIIKFICCVLVGSLLGQIIGWILGQGLVLLATVMEKLGHLDSE